MTPNEKRRLVALVRRWSRLHDQNVNRSIRSRRRGRPLRRDAYMGVAYGICAVMLLRLLQELNAVKPADILRAKTPRRKK